MQGTAFGRKEASSGLSLSYLKCLKQQQPIRQGRGEKSQVSRPVLGQKHFFLSSPSKMGREFFFIIHDVNS